MVAVSALTIAELVGGLHGVEPGLTRMRRERHLRYVQANVEPLNFDLCCARAFGWVYEAPPVLAASLEVPGQSI